MKNQLPTNVHHVQGCYNLIDPARIPLFVTREHRHGGDTLCWCTRAVGMELIVYSGGNGIVRTPGVINTMHAGAICLSPSDVKTVHIPNPNGFIDYWNFLFLEEALRLGDLNLTETEGYRRLKQFQGEGENRLSPVFCIDDALVTEVNTLASEATAAQTFQTPGWKVFCTATILYLMARIFSEFRQDSQSFTTIETQIERMAAFIERNCAQQLTLEALATRAGMSPSSFSHHFRAIREVPPVEYLIRCRLRKAISMFATHNDISQIALECGFAEQAYFSRLFRKRIGLSPSEFRLLPLAEQQRLGAERA